MPNWTDNLLIIDGPVENVRAFFTELSSKNNQLTNLMPVPDELQNIKQGSRQFDGVRVDAWYEDDEGARPMLDIRKEELTEKYGTYKSIDWEYANWGTKWGDCETEVHTTNEGKKIITFQSAWGPPWKLLHDIAVKYEIEIIDNVQYEFEEGVHIDKYPMKDEQLKENLKGDEYFKDLMKNVTVIKD